MLAPLNPDQRSISRYQSTLLFCDIRGFTQFFDLKPPEETFAFITSVLQRITRIVRENKGKISTFTGDGFLAQFGFSGVDENSGHEACAVRAAISIRDELKKINVERHADHNFAFTLGIGINTGTVASGAVEFADSHLYLVLGDTVNTASRIENLCKFFSVDILIAESTEAAVRGQFPLMPMPEKELRGKTGKYKTYWVMPTAQAAKQ